MAQREQDRDETDDSPQEESRWTWIIPVSLILLLVALYFIVPPFNAFINKAYGLLSSGDRQGFQSWLQSFGAWGPVVVLVMMVLQTLLAFIPSVLIMVVTIVAFGPLWGGVLTWTGLMVAALVAYGIGRAVGPATLYSLIGQKTEEKVEAFVKEYGIWAIIAARISPALSTDAVSFVGGLVQMNLLKFAAATGVGILPLTALIAYLGADFGRLERGLIWVSVISVALFVGYVVWDRLRD